MIIFFQVPRYVDQILSRTLRRRPLYDPSSYRTITLNTSESPVLI